MKFANYSNLLTSFLVWSIFATTASAGNPDACSLPSGTQQSKLSNYFNVNIYNYPAFALSHQYNSQPSDLLTGYIQYGIKGSATQLAPSLVTPKVSLFGYSSFGIIPNSYFAELKGFFYAPTSGTYTINIKVNYSLMITLGADLAYQRCFP